MRILRNHFPEIQEGSTRFSGGSQLWLDSKIGRDTGCGAVAAANALAALASKREEIATALGLSKEADGSFTKESYLAFMEEVFAAVGTWHLFGHAAGIGITRLIVNTLRFAKKRGVYLKVRTISAPYVQKTSLRSFIREGLIVSSAVILPTALNSFIATLEDGRKVKIRRHFVTIYDISDDAKTVYISTWGRKGSVPFDELFRSMQTPLAIDTALIYFKPALSKEETNQALLKAAFPLVRTMRSALFRF